jgi:hypothetical protein
MRADMELDGWRTAVLTANSTEAVTAVKARIVQEYFKDPAHTKALLCIGFVPVPFSGNINVDGYADHTGAWATDAYYGDMTGTWTDNSVNVNPSIASSRNVPGDGKFDQSRIPADGQIRMGVGRIVFDAMPAFSTVNRSYTNIELTRRYLTKLHRYKTGNYQVPNAMFLQDNLFPFNPARTEAAGDWIDGMNMIGEAEVQNNTLMGSAQGAGAPRWLMGCMSGSGTWESCGGVADATQLAIVDSTSVVFTKAFGSYFGDFFLANNFMRALIASKGATLSCSWSGRPSHAYGSMAIGEPLARVAQEMMGGGFIPQSTASIHNAVMGDITLHLRYIRPATNAQATRLANNHIRLTWAASPDASTGYYVYRASGTGFYEPLTPQPITGLSFVDTLPFGGANTYQIRAVRYEFNPTGRLPTQALGVQTNTILLASGIDNGLVWQGTQSTDWNNPLNWLPTRVPGKLDSVTIRPATFQPIIQDVAFANNLFLDTGSRLTIPGLLSLSGHLLGSGHVSCTGTLSFISGIQGLHHLNIRDSLVAANVVLNDTSGVLRILSPLRIRRSLNLHAGLLYCDAQVTLEATPTSVAFLHPMGDVVILQPQRFVIEQYLPPAPVGTPGLWHLLTPMVDAQASFYSQNNPYLPTTFSSSFRDTSSLYRFGRTNVTNLSRLGWMKRYTLATSIMEKARANRVWVQANTHFGMGGMSKLYHRGKPNKGIIGFFITDATFNSTLVDSNITTYLGLMGNPYPCPIWDTLLFDTTSNFNYRDGTRPSYQYDPVKKNYKTHWRGFGALNGGSPIIPAGGAAFFVGPAYNPRYEETWKYTADTLPYVPKGRDGAMSRLRIILKDSIEQNEILLCMTRDTLLRNDYYYNYAHHLYSENPSLYFDPVGRKVIKVEYVYPDSNVSIDTVYIGTQNLLSTPTKLIFKDEGAATDYTFILLDRLTGLGRVLNQGRDSATVVYQPGRGAQYALIRLRPGAVRTQTRLEPKFILQPNPATDALSVTTVVPGQLRITNALGQLLRTEYVETGTQTIAVQGLPPGLYNASLNGKTVRWVKQ